LLLRQYNEIKEIKKSTPTIKSQNQIRIEGPLTARSLAYSQHNEMMMRLNTQRTSMKIDKAEGRFWTLYNEKTNNKKDYLTVDELYEIEEEFNNLNGKSIVEKQGAGMVVIENGNSYMVKIYSVISDLRYKTRMNFCSEARNYNIFERVLGIAPHMKLKIRKFNEILTQDDMEIELVAKKFKIEDLLKMLTPKGLWEMHENKKKSGQTKITDFLI